MATETSTAPTFAEPQKEHEWLQRLVGDWTYEVEASEPGKPPERSNGTETVRSLGGLWTIAESQGEHPAGGTVSTLMTLGFDPQKNRYVGTFIGSMMTNLWVYEGTLDDATGMLTLESEGPSFSGDRSLAKYRDVFEFRSNDHRMLTSHVQDEHGSWQKFMTIDYRRRR